MREPSSRLAQAPDSSEAHAEPDLEFPDWSGAVSEPRRLPWDVIYRRSLEALPFEMAKPGFEERRLAMKSRTEFVL